MTKAHTENAKNRHPFSFTLGEGPYKFVGTYDLGRAVAAVNNGSKDTAAAFQDAPRLDGGMGTCAHCGHGIMNIMIIRTGEGKLYGVGSDCVRKVAADGDVSAVSEMERAIRHADKIKRKERECALSESLEPDFQAALIKLEAYPHPNTYFASQGKTLADYYRFLPKSSRNKKSAISKAKENAK